MSKKKRSNKVSTKGKKAEPRSLKHKSFWLVISLMLLISISVILGLSGSESFTGNAGIQLIATAKSGSHILHQVNEGVIETTDTYFNGPVSRGKITYQKDSDILFSGKFISKVRIATTDIDFSKMDLVLKINKEELTKKVGLTPDDIRVYINNKEVPTSKIKDHRGYIYLGVTITEVGDLVVGRKKIEPVIDTVEPQKVKIVVPITDQAPEPIKKPQVQEPVPMKEVKKLSLWERFLNLFR
jgi:hypothetical protein